MAAINPGEEFSDLTSLDDDDDYVASQSSQAKAKKTRKAQGGANAEPEEDPYTIQNALKVPRATTYTAQSLFEQIQQADIDLDPEYQRAVVWPESKQIGLIDSIFRNFYIPPVIFAVRTYDDGTEMRTCIDGKQRLTSIARFMAGHIPHRDPITKEVLWYKDITEGKGKHQKRILPSKYRVLFSNKQVVCVEYADLTDMDERDIFQRVQLGMALSPSEKLQVIASDRATFIRDLLSERLDDHSPLVLKLKWDRSRGNDFRFVAQSVFMMDKWKHGSVDAKGRIVTKKGEIPRGSESAGAIEKYLTGAGDIPASFKTRIRRAYDIFRDIADSTQMRGVVMNLEDHGGEIKLAPIEFTTIVVLIERHMDDMSVGQLVQAIKMMRLNIREQWVDIRANSRISKALLEFIGRLDSRQVPDPLSPSKHKKRGRPPKKHKSEAEMDESDAELPDASDAESTKPRHRSARKRVIGGIGEGNRRKTGKGDGEDVEMGDIGGEKKEEGEMGLPPSVSSKRKTLPSDSGPSGSGGGTEGGAGGAAAPRKKSRLESLRELRADAERSMDDSAGDASYPSSSVAPPLSTAASSSTLVNPSSPPSTSSHAPPPPLTAQEPPTASFAGLPFPAAGPAGLPNVPPEVMTQMYAIWQSQQMGAGSGGPPANGADHAGGGIPRLNPSSDASGEGAGSGEVSVKVEKGE